MPSRNRFLSYQGLCVVLAVASACIDAQEDKKASSPPPIVGTGTGKRTSGASAQPAGSSATSSQAAGGSAGSRTQTMTTSAADGGKQRADAAEAQADLDAGPSVGGTGAAGAVGVGGRGGSSGAAAGSGGRSGAGGSSSAGQGGAAGGASSEACMNQLCFTLVDCWLLSAEDCAYVACDNFVCR